MEIIEWCIAVRMARKKEKNLINDGIIKIIVMGWLIAIGTFFGKILLKLGLGKLICLLLRMAWLEKNNRKDVLKVKGEQLL